MHQSNQFRSCISYDFADLMVNGEYNCRLINLFFLWRCGPTRAMASSFLRFLDHTQRRITVGRTPLGAWSARRTDLYLPTHNTHNKHPCSGEIRTHDLSRRVAADLRLRPRGHRDRRSCNNTWQKRHVTIAASGEACINLSVGYDNERIHEEIATWLANS